MLNHRLLNIVFTTTFIICLGLGNVSLTLGQIRVGESATAQIIDLKPLIQQGVERYKAGDFQGAIAVWNTALNNQPGVADRVTILKHLVRVYSQVGQVDRTIASLNQLIAHYQEVGDRLQLGRMLTEQAQAYSSLGQQQKAIALLCGDQIEPNCGKESALAIAHEQSDQLGEAAGLGSLGTIHRLRGDYETSLRLLQKSLAIAQNLKNPVYVTAAENELGNTYASLAKRDYRYAEFASDSNDVTAIEKFTQQAVEHDHNAVTFFEASLAAARQQRDLPNEVRSLLNLAVSYQRIKESAAAETTLKQAFYVLDRLPDSQDKTYGLIRFVNLLQRSSAADHDPNVQCLPHTPAETVTLLNQAIAIAQRIRDPRAESFALGRLGHLYECQQDLIQALKLTQQAQLVGQQQESRYLWDWQAGRILQAQGKPIDAIRSYESSVKTLKEIRGDLAIASRDFQFDFRDTVEPVYRELTQLQLQSPTNKTLEKQNIHLESALKTIDSLRLAELQNYLGGDCSITLSEKPITSVGEKTAIISTIILKNRIAVILTLPNANKKSQSKVYWMPAQTKTVMATVNELRLKLEERSDLANTYQEPSQQIYNWLIGPFAQDLQTAQTETLVFIQDGILRSIPMTALYNGKQFLVQQYAITSALSLNLTEPTRINPHSLRVLEFGLTKSSAVAGRFFEPLSYVKTELDRIKAALPGSKEFVDEAFTIDRLEQELTQGAFPIVHLATHGKFGIDSRDTFLVTGKHNQNNNETLTLNQLYQILQNKSLELLTLTACETAIGSDRDALGIAGISLQAGARSAIASLWQVDDQSTAELIGQFYQNLHQGMGRAKALQSAQKNWLQQHSGDRNHPGYWAALILVGNWL